MSVHEHLEHAEHIAHSGGGHGHGDSHGGASGLGRTIGVTMAILGVLIAFSSAMVGGSRTDLVATMIEHGNVVGQGQAVSTKYRVLQAELQQLHAMLPDVAALKKVEARRAELLAGATADGASAAALKALDLETRKILNTVTPTQTDLLRFGELARQYTRERKLTQEWAESFEGRILVHERAAERFEIASLCAEIGIVMASIALLLQSRGMWIVSILFGATGVVALIFTGFTSHRQLAAANAQIAEARASYRAAAAGASEEKADEKLLLEITGQEEESASAVAPPAGAEQGHEPARPREQEAH